MDDFQSVAGSHRDLRPARSLCNLTVVLYGDPIALQIHSSNHLFEHYRRHQLGKHATLAINNEVQ